MICKKNPNPKHNHNLKICLLFLLNPFLPVTAFAYQVYQVYQVIDNETKETALRDRSILPRQDIPFTYYLYLPKKTQPNQYKEFFNVLAFTICSTSTNSIIEYSVPQRLSENLFRINIKDLGWSHKNFLTVLSSNPYTLNNENPLFIRADWFLSILSDTTKTDAYYRLLFNNAPSKLTRDQILRQLDAEKQEKYRFGLIEEQSGVSLSRTRIIENRPKPRGYVWGTRDSSKKDPFDDPIPPFTQFKHEAEEWIIGIPKQSITSEVRGTLQVYFLSTSTGTILNKADTDIVEDHSRFKGLAAIRVPGSCIQCHIEGINYPSSNGLKQLILSGVDLYTDKTSQEKLELFHLSPISKEIRRNNEDFQDVLKFITGKTSKEFLPIFKGVIANYENRIEIDDIKAEINSTEFMLALGSANNKSYALNARLAGLAHNQGISRRNWERNYRSAIEIMKLWSERKEKQ